MKKTMTLSLLLLAILLTGVLCFYLNRTTIVYHDGDRIVSIRTYSKGEDPKELALHSGEKLGYAFLGWYIDPELTVPYQPQTLPKESYRIIRLYAKYDYATLELPILQINTNGGRVESKSQYTPMTLDLLNTETEALGLTGGIRIRGNTSSIYPKKPYRITLDTEASLFGLPTSQDWLLLAEYLDPSGLHNYTALSLAAGADGLPWTPTAYKVNVYLNDTYMGLYTLCERPDEGEGRMGIETTVTPAMTDIRDYNFYISMNQSVTTDRGAVLGEDYFYLKEYDRYFELKYPKKADFPSEQQFEKFFRDLADYTKYIMDIYSAKDLDAMERETNLESLMDFMILDQIMGETDHYYKSFNMYYTAESNNPATGGKLTFGPVWDYDWCLHTPWTNKPNQYYQVFPSLHFSNLFYLTVNQTPELYERMMERYRTYFSPALEAYIENLEELTSSMEVSYEMNRKKWYWAYPESITQDNVQFLEDYLTAWKAYLDTVWG